MRIVNTDAKSHSAKTLKKCLQETERVKKKIFLEACLQQHQHFSTFATSVDGLLGVDAAATLKIITSYLTTKWRQTYSRTCGYVKSRVAITLVRATHRYIRGSRLTAHKISVQSPQWEDGAVINLFQLSVSRYPKTRQRPHSSPNPLSIPV